MNNYFIKLELKSPCLIGSGEGFGAIIDTDVIFDDVGIPFVPAKRIKGCLLDSAIEIQEMFERAEICFSMQPEKIFGSQGASEPAPVYFSNLYIENYEGNKMWLEYFTDNYSEILSKEQILKTFTQIRQQTAIGQNGVAHDHSLRTVRVVEKGTVFYGDIHMQENDDAILKTLSFACANFRYMGTKRTRGFGEVRCSLLDNALVELAYKEKLGEICTN